MASKLTPQQSPQESSASFWQLISGVAHDLDLMLQDLFPDSIPSPLREEYGLANDIALDHEAFASHATLLEQFMRGAGPDNPYAFSAAPDPCGEYRGSKPQFPETPTSDSCDGRTTPTSTSSPSPPPPAPPPRALLPNYSAHLQAMPPSSHAGAQSAMVSSSSVSSVQDTSDGDSSHTSSSFAPCDIGLLERLIRTHPIWFLPSIGRAGAVHLLQGKDIGNFIVRQSSKPNTMALSVRLPEDKGPYVEHYLIETVGDAQLRLEGSDNNFHAIPMLVAHYCQCCDELPVQLALPCPLAQAGSRQELSSLALLGQDFWLSSLVRSPANGPPTGPLPSSLHETLPQHSTFKPGPSTTNPPTTLTFNSEQQPHDFGTPSSGSPPPPIAPKHQIHAAPPPPPPRSFNTTKLTANTSVVTPPQQQQIPVVSSDTSPDLSSSCNNDNSSHEQTQGSDAEVPAKDKPEDEETKKGDKKIPRVAHYKQSNIADLPSVYYKSTLADKISDYEDIWGNSLAKEGERKAKLKTFQPTFNPDSIYVEKLRRKNFEIFRRQQSDNIGIANYRYTYTQGTQTEIPVEVDTNNLQNYAGPSGIEKTIDIQEVTPEDEGNFSSPFYSEPVDSLPLDGENIRISGLIDTDYLPQRLLNHRFSDPNLHWPQNTSVRKIELALDEDRLASLSSSVDNLKGLGPSHLKPNSLALSTNWVQELNYRISSHSFKRDCQTQVSTHDLLVEKVEVKKSSPKKIKGLHNNASWPLDSSWEWLAHDDSSSSSDENEAMLGCKFPLHIKSKDSDSQFGDTTTVEDLIALRSPELTLPQIRPLTQNNIMRASEYDNLECVCELQEEVEHQRNSDIVDDTATEFCEPWDSLRWERLLRLVIPETDILGDDDTIQREKNENQRNFVIENNEKNQLEKSEDIVRTVSFEDNESNSTVSAYSDLTSEGVDDTSGSEYPTINTGKYRNKSFEERLEPLLAAQRVVALRNRCNSKIGENIRNYIFRLAHERNNTFAMSIENFIQCTKESTETNPAVVMRNIRQFMSGIKNYLLKHGEGRFENLLQEERSKLKSDEFLDIDAVVEDSLHKLVIKPLKGFIYQLFVNEYTRNGSLKLLSDNIRFARTKTPEELGVRPEFKLPEGTSLEVVNHFFNRLQQAYSPLKKLENLLAAISAIYNSVQQDKIAQGKENVSLGAGDFLPIFICVLVRCGLIAAEIEADYMWGLLHPSLMAREGGYYLTTLSSAVHVLKSLQACSPESPQHSFDSLAHAGCSGRSYSSDMGSPRSQMGCKTPSPEPRLACIADLQGFLKIMIPDELTGSIISKTLPIKPNMTTKEVAKLIAHKFNVTNPQDYCLYKLVNGEETVLGDGECPQVIKADLMAAGSNCLFTYKRCDAKFIWPILEKSS